VKWEEQMLVDAIMGNFEVICLEIPQKIMTSKPVYSVFSMKVVKE
jgi:hypothetical protein